MPLVINLGIRHCYRLFYYLSHPNVIWPLSNCAFSTVYFVFLVSVPNYLCIENSCLFFSMKLYLWVWTYLVSWFLSLLFPVRLGLPVLINFLSAPDCLLPEVKTASRGFEAYFKTFFSCYAVESFDFDLSVHPSIFLIIYPTTVTRSLHLIPGDFVKGAWVHPG